MSQNVAVLQQLKQWADELQAVRNKFAVGVEPGAYDDFDKILEEMRKFIVRASNE